MRIMKLLYYFFLFSFFGLSWFKILPSEHLLWILLSTIAALVVLHVISYRKFGKVVSLDTKTDSIVIIAGMLLLLVVQFAVIDR